VRKPGPNPNPEGRSAGGSEQKALKRQRLSEIRPIPRRGLSRIEAAMYIGVSARKFDELIADGRMPKPKRVDGRKLWDIRELDLAFDALGDEAELADDTWSDFSKHPVKG
jgi:predicted DNA-binding transcriptional regulator AlpA